MDVIHILLGKFMEDQSSTTQTMVEVLMVPNRDIMEVAILDLIIAVIEGFLELLAVILRVVHQGVLGMVTLDRNCISYLSVKFAAKGGILHLIVSTEMINHLLLLEEFLNARFVANADIQL